MSESLNGKLEIKAENEKEFILKEFLLKYTRFIPWVVLSVVACLILAYTNLRYAKPIYRVSGKLFINKDNKSKPSSSLEDIFMFGDNVNLSNEVQILQSTPIIERVVKSLKLNQAYYNKGNVITSRIYGVEPFKLVPVIINDSAKSFNIVIKALEKSFTLGENANIEVPYNSEFQIGSGIFRLERDSMLSLSIFNTNEFIVSYQPLERAAGSMVGALQVSPINDQASILLLSMETENIKMGKDFVNEIMTEYGRMNMEDKRKISQITIQFIDERLDTLKEELGSVEGNLLSYKEKNEIYDLKSQSGIYFDELAENNKSLTEKKVQISILDYLFGYLGENKNQFKIVPSNLGIEEPTLAPLIIEYNRLQLQRENILRTTGQYNPSLIAIDANISKIREQLLETLRNVKQSYRIAESDIQRQLDKAKSKMVSVPAKEKQLLDIERQQKIKQELYLFLLQKREEAAISSAATIANSRILEYASSSGVPVSPQKKNQYLLALFAGLLIPALIIFISELLNDKVTTKEEIEKSTATPVLGEIGHVDDYKSSLVVSYGSRTIIAEQFRITRTNLQYMITKEMRPVIMITSTMSGEGKSFIAANFGAAISLSGKKTVILEFDIRKPKLLKNLDMKSSKGLSNYIIGKAELDEIINPVNDYSNLFVIGCGPIPPNPAELLLEEKVETLFTELKKRFDVIVVDTAPVGLVSDAQALSRFADASLYIVRQGYTLKKQLRLIDNFYQQKKLPNMAIVVNDIKIKGRYSGYYGYGQNSNYSFGNSYGYGTEYFEETRKNRKVFSNITNRFKRKS
jgi:capsular exopolysaccharide synthesis family protein